MMRLACAWIVLAAWAAPCFAQQGPAPPAPLRVVMDNNFPPYAFVDDSGRVVGYEIDLWRLWEKQTGRKVEITATSWAEAQQRLRDGQADVIDMLYKTPQRAAIYAFSEPYASQQVSIYTRESVSGIANVTALRGFVVGVERGDACIEQLRHDGITTLKLYAGYREIIRAAARKEFAAFCMDDAPAQFYLYQGKYHARFKLAFNYYRGQLRRAVLKDRQAVLQGVQRGMRQISAAQRAQLRRKWMGDSLYFTPYTKILGAALAVLVGLSLLALLAIRALRRAIAEKTAELQRKNLQLSTLIDSSPDLIWMKNTEGVYLACNPVTAAFIGRAPEQIIGSTDADMLAPALAGTLRQSDLKALECDDISREEHTLVHATSGQSRILEIMKSRILDLSGNPSGIVAFARDITERKLAEERLQQAAKVFESTRDAIVVTDADRKIVTVNTAFVRIMGHAMDEVVGKSPSVLGIQGSARREFAAMWDSRSHQDTWQGEIWCRRKSGELFPTWWRIHLARDSDGNVTHVVALFSDISKDKLQTSQIKYLTSHDLLTKLPNRSLLLDRLEQKIRRAAEKTRSVAVMTIGLDNFKRINSSLDHSAGDELLKTVAKRLQKLLSAGYSVARSGGDEFAVIFTDTTDASGLTHWAERILEAIAEPVRVNGQENLIRASIGIAVYPADGNDAISLTQCADTAMHDAKAHPLNKVHFYNDAMSRDARRLHALEVDLRKALDQNQFELFYQPQWEGRSGRVSGYEALVRWRRPGIGVVGPDQFIPFAEENGLIVPLGRWILYKACITCAHWSPCARADCTVAVNVSAVQLAQPDFTDDVHAALQASGLPAHRLELEITESQLVQQISEVRKVLEALRDMGVRLAIDDFGTGYSSLAYLRHLPVDVLKIDKSFIDDIARLDESRRIVAAIVSMAHTLNLEVVAEGVETQAQVRLLEAMGCNRMQGHYLSPAIAALELPAFFAKVG